MRTHDVIGTVGVLFIIVDYWLLQTDKVNSKSLVYSVLNGVGATLILISLMFEFNTSAFLVEIFWLGISVYGIWRWKSKRETPAEESRPG